MRLLILLPRFPYPPTQGDKIRAWAQLTFLAARHDVWLASMCDVKPPREEVYEARRRCADLAIDDRSTRVRLAAGAASLIRGDSLTEGYFRSPLLQRTIAGWTARAPFDAALVFSSGMMVNVPPAFAGRLVLDMNDVDSRKWRFLSVGRSGPRRWLYALEADRVERWERRCTRRADVNVLVNDREAVVLKGISPEACCAVVRTGASTVPNSFPADVPPEPIVGFVGSMNYAPNVEAVEWFAASVWPTVKRRRPDAQWIIVGRDPCRAVRRLGALDGVTVTGTVPDVTPLVRDIRVMVVPQRSPIGVQTKLIEAMSQGKASVVSTHVADGITTGRFEPFLVAADENTFAGHVCRLLAEDAAVRRIGRDAWACADVYYRGRDQLARLEELLKAGTMSAGRPERRASPEPATA